MNVSPKSSAFAELFMMCFKPIKVAPKNISMMIRFLEAVLTKSNAGEDVMDKEKLLQWLRTALPDPNENVQLCHVLAKASIVSNFASWCFCEPAMPRSGRNTCRHRRRSATLTLNCPQVGSFHVHCCCIMCSDIGYTAFSCEGPLRQ